MPYFHGAKSSPIELGAGFELVGASPAAGVNFDNYVGRNRNGDYIAATNQQRNKREDFVVTFRAVNPDGATAQVTLGGNTGYDGYIATRVEVDQVNTEDAIVRITLHKNDGNNNLHSTRSVQVALPSCGYGVLATPLTGGTPPENCIRMNWSAAVDHRDRTNKLGDHLYGFSHGCLLEATQEYVDDEGSISPDNNWHIDSDLPAEENTDAGTRVVRGHSFQALS